MLSIPTTRQKIWYFKLNPIKNKIMSIVVSKKYGLNPSVQLCSCCGKDMGLIMFGASYKDENGKTAEAPHQVMTGAICDECKKVIDEGGVFFIEVRDGETGKKNPYRTGRLTAVKREACEKMFKGFQNINYMEQSLFSKVFKNAF